MALGQGPFPANTAQVCAGMIYSSKFSMALSETAAIKYFQSSSFWHTLTPKIPFKSGLITVQSLSIVPSTAALPQKAGISAKFFSIFLSMGTVFPIILNDSFFSILKFISSAPLIVILKVIGG